MYRTRLALDMQPYSEAVATLRRRVCFSLPLQAELDEFSITS